MLLLVLLLTTTINAATATLTLPNCSETCGNITVPYPFGIEAGCHLPGFRLTCTSSDHLFLYDTNYLATDISLSTGTVHIDGNIARDCYEPLDLAPDVTALSFDVTGLPYTISSERNRFTVLGCDAVAINSDRDANGYVTGCIALCGSDRDVIPNGTCSGIGCCQTKIPAGMKVLKTVLSALRNHTTTWNISPCSYAFVVDQDRFEFDVTMLEVFYKRSSIPMVLDWSIGEDTCDIAVASSNYVCGQNTSCVNSTNGGGYRCSCSPGYEGNPYLIDGCQDIDECASASTNPCSNICTNTLGSYTCSCPRGTSGDGKKLGSGCIEKNSRFPLVQVILGIGLGSIFFIVIISWMYWATKKRNMLLLQEKFFKQNGGLLLQQHIASYTTTTSIIAPTPRIFTTKELEAATNRYSPTRILGSGTYGTVYKGILSDGSAVAIKKANVIDPSQTEQFVNEVLILSQIVHPNVVRLIGCCLETEVPLLVYEFVPNGTLSVHLRGRGLSWSMRLRIAMETASALAHLHGATSRPIIHRDVKSANILLDGEFTAKVADFGASRLIPLDKKEVLTLVQGTLGYLDPEYFQTGYLSEKSDVYSFGVVVAELLTGEAVLVGERVLATWFLKAVEEGRLFSVIEERVRNEGRREQVKGVAELAGKCLRLKGEERPTMKEVVGELERWKQWRVDRHRHPWVGENREGLLDEEGDAETRYYSIVQVRE